MSIWVQNPACAPRRLSIKNSLFQVRTTIAMEYLVSIWVQNPTSPQPSPQINCSGEVHPVRILGPLLCLGPSGGPRGGCSGSEEGS